MRAAAYYLQPAATVGSTLGDDGVALHVEAHDADGPLSFVVVAALHRTVVYDIRRTVLVEEKRRVDTVNLWQHDGLAPAFVRVGGLHEEVADAHAGGNHVVGLVLSVVLDVRGEDALRHPLSVQGQLRRAVEHMSQLLPVDEILALEDGNAGEERERRVDQIERVAHTADAGVGVESRQDGVHVLCLRVVLLLEAHVVARVLEIGVVGILCREGCLATQRKDEGHGEFFHCFIFFNGDSLPKRNCGW